jgi:hypothetical protein
MDLGRRLMDRFLLLYLLDRMKARGAICGKLQIQKLVFLAEVDSVLRDKCGHPSFPFVRYTYGPFAREIDEHANKLNSTKFLNGLRVTQRGTRLVEHWVERVRGYVGSALGRIDDVVESKGGLSGGALKRLVYSMPARPLVPDARKTETIEDLPHNRTLLVPSSLTGLKTVDLPKRVFLDLYLDFALTDQDVEESKSFSKEANRKVADMLGWHVDSDGAVSR